MSNTLIPEVNCFYYNTVQNVLLFCDSEWHDCWRFKVVNDDYEFGISKDHLEEGVRFLKKIAFISND